MNDPMPHRKIDRVVVAVRASRLAFRVERGLESYLEVQLSLLLMNLGQDLLIIGRQVNTVGRRVDLLAINATGVIYIIELKLNEASPSIIAQVLDYRRWIRQLTRDEFIRVVADGPLHVDLVDAFQRHFGHALVDAVNESQVLMIIAASIHPRTARAILELKDIGCSITTFRYVVRSDAVSLIPCCRDDQDMEALHAETRLPALRKRSTPPVLHWSPRYRVGIKDNVREFWLTHAPQFASPIVLFSVIYAQYKEWFREQAAEGLQSPVVEGLFGQQLAAIVAATDEWAHVYVPTGISMETLGALKTLPPTRPRQAAGFHTVAYMRNPVSRELDH
jgi:hypothetical protein